MWLGAVLSVLLWGGFYGVPSGWLSDVRELSMDGSWRLLSRAQEERRIVLIDVDERSLQEVGAWPWPRATQARLIQGLADQGVALQALDIVFVSGDASDSGEAHGHARSSRDNLLLGQTLAAQRPVLAQAFAFPGQGGQTTSGALFGELDWPGCGQPFAVASGYLGNHQDLFKGMTQTQDIPAGHITPRISGDGVVRHQPAVICYQDKAYPALALASASLASAHPHWSLQRGSSPTDPAWSLAPDQTGLPPVPLARDGTIRVPWWIKPQGFISISASDVLKGRLEQDMLRGAWVVVGSSAFGLNDSVATPFFGAAAGMLVHAQLMSGLLDGRIPYQPLLEPYLQLALVLAGLFCMWALTRNAQPQSPHQGPRQNAGLSRSVPRGRVLPALASTVAGRVPMQALPLLGLSWAALLWMVHLSLLQGMGWVLDWISPSLAVVSGAVAWGVAEHTRTRRERERLYAHLSSYLPAPVAASLALEPPSSAIHARTQLVSVMFADVRNFSAYCESRPPQEAAAVLHAYFTVAARIVAQHGGVIESFQGDAVIAVWQEEQDQSDGHHGRAAHASRALDAAVQLHAAMAGVLPDPAPAGLEPLALGVGVESGPAMVGSFGLASRRTHMVMGRTVTIASRLVEMTAELAHPVLVGEGLAALVPPERLRSMGTFLLDGLSVPHHLYASVQAGPGVGLHGDVRSARGESAFPAGFESVGLTQGAKEPAEDTQQQMNKE